MGLVAALRRSFENPATSLSDPAQWVLDMFGGGTSDSGIDVNRKTSLGLPPLFRATVLISTDVAKLPLLTYKRLREGGKERDPSHPAYRLLRHKPVPEMTAFTFKQTLQGHALLKGNGYAYIKRQGNGVPLELWILNPDITFPRYAPDGSLWYLTKVKDEDRRLPARDVLHHKGLGFDGLQGYSIIEVAADAIGLGLGVQKYRGKFFANNARPSAVIEHPAQIGENALKNLKQSWNEMHSGLENAHRVAVLEEGMKLNPFSINAKDAQLVESLPFTARDVSCLTGVPSHKLGDPERSSYASLEQENQSYLDDCLDGWLNGFEEECWDKLLTEQEKAKDTHVIEFVRAALVRADLNTRYNAYHTALLDGWMNRDEVRTRENMNPLPDGQGQEFYEPMNMGKAGETEQPRGITQAQRALVVDALVRMTKRIGNAAERQAKKGGDAFYEWLDDKFHRANQAVFVDALAAPVRLIAESVEDWPGSLEQIERVYFDTLRERLLSATECAESELVQNVNAAVLAYEKECGNSLTDKMLKDKSYAPANAD